MTRYKGGDRVRKGTYWDFKSGNRVDMAGEGILPGDERSKYVRCPPVLVLLSGPVVGLFYVVALPFIALGTILTLAAGKLLTGIVSIVPFGWRPGEAHLGGKRKKQK
ncbi:MAG: hypothetical protein ABSA46_04930 [Thermodesulfovibrionales bacterium]|jgi:hypothetical protein